MYNNCIQFWRCECGVVWRAFGEAGWWSVYSESVCTEVSCRIGGGRWQIVVGSIVVVCAFLSVVSILPAWRFVEIYAGSRSPSSQ